MHLNKRALWLALILSAPVVCWVAGMIVQRHATTKHAIATYLSSLICDAVDCDFTMHVKELSFIPLTLTCTNVTARPRSTQEHWQWQCDEIVFRCSWLSIITQKKLSTWLTIDRLNADTAINEHGLAIAGHLQQLFFGIGNRAPVLIRGISIDDFHLTLQHPTTAAHLAGSIRLKKMGPQLATTWYFSDSTLTYKNTTITGIHGLVNASLHADTLTHLWGTLSAHVPQLEPHASLCTITAQLQNQQIVAHAHNQDQTFNLHATTDAQAQKTRVTGSIASALLYDLIPVPVSLRLIQDTLDLDATIQRTPIHCQATITPRTFPFKASGVFDGNAYQATITCQRPYTAFKKTLIPGQCTCTCAGTLSGPHTAQLRATLTSKHQTMPIELNGTLHNTRFTLNGAINGYQLVGAGSIDSHPRLEHLTLSKHHKTVATVQLEYAPPLSGTATISYKEMQALLPDWIRAHTSGTGTITLRAWGEHGTLSFQGVVVIPSLLNAITGLNAELAIDPLQKLITAHAVKLTLQQGTITIPHAHWFYQLPFKITFAHVPVSLHQCAINFGSFDASITGAGIMRYCDDLPAISGALVIEKAHLYQPPHTAASPANAWAATPVDVTITSKKPIAIHLPAFNGKASLDCTIRNTLNAPLITGTVTLQGTLPLPTADLRITRGIIYSNPHDTTDPLIDILAHADIDQYTVSVGMTGTLNHPLLHLQASPTLTEEQIASLLVAGSTETTLNSVASTLIMDNLAQYLSSTLYANQHGNTLWSKIFKKLPHLKLMPQFDNQADLQSIYGAVEIDLGKKVKAKIQKNLTADEQAAIELDYKISDDVSVKAFKNEQGDLGSVVQLRLKL